MVDLSLDLEPVDLSGLDDHFLTAFLTVNQRRQVQLMLEGITFADCEQLTTADHEAGALFEGLQLILRDLTGHGGNG